MNYVKLYLIAFVLFFLSDLLWIGLIAKNFYQSQIGDLMTDKIVWSAAIIFYLLYIFGLLYFGIIPAIQGNIWSKALINGALIGLISYATYDLTNLATLSGWPIKMVVYDLIWGTIISSTVCTITFFLAKFLQITIGK